MKRLPIRSPNPVSRSGVGFALVVARGRTRHRLMEPAQGFRIQISYRSR